MPTIASSPCFPLCLGAQEDFARVREYFRDAAFEQQTLCRLLTITDMSDLGRVAWDKVPFDSISAPLRWCIQIFARGLLASEEESRAICGSAFASFEELGLLRRSEKHPDKVLCPVWIYPVADFIIASDRCSDPEGDTFTPAEDVVFPAIYQGTLRFLRLLPEVRGGEALDICGGTGIGALCLSKSARRSATADLTERSALFAEFNARLNAMDVESLCGDLFEPAGQRMFDVISAHPPFVPASGQHMVYRDGGETGEQITRRIIEALGQHLRPGGVCVILCVACDTTDKPFEQRACEWLGEWRKEFDVVFGLEKILSLEEVVGSLRKRGQQMSEDGARELLARLRSFSTSQFVYGALVLRRYANPSESKPFRIHMTPDATAGDFERLLAWRQQCGRPDFVSWLLASRPRLAPQVQLTVRHAVKDGSLMPVEFMFSIAAGFESALRPDAWLVPLVARLEGQKSVGQVFQEACAADELPAGFSVEAFSHLVRLMIERRLLEVDLPT
jgi:methylase of polypeptide subunit release factors